MQSAAEVNPTDEQYSEEDSEQYLTFKLAGEEYGVEILRVQGIQGLQKVTTIPNTPEYILGVINLRGEIVPVIDLRKRFSLESIEFSSTTVVIVVRMINEGKERTLGVVVDGVSEVYRFENKNVQEPPEFGGAISTEFLKGLASVDEKMVILLEIDHLVDFNDLVNAAQAGGAE
ncbi:MAG: chemotaxis protein CheW [Gammaproteobacteria bacterium]